MILAISVGVLVSLSALYLAVRNRLVKLRNQVSKAWANIDTLLQRRHDEIPSLVEVCRGHMAHEAGLLERLVDERSRYDESSAMGARVLSGLAVSHSLSRLLALSERYPELRANQSFAHLTARLTSLEEQIADRREFFNECVNLYNTRIGQFPFSLVAGIMEADPIPFWDPGRGIKS